nr:uncharacterized protein LOC112710546 [Arachis hypogaea]
MSYEIVPVFHHGGSFERDEDGALFYRDGSVETFPPLDIDYVNFKDLEEMFKGLGYTSYKQMYWYDGSFLDLESGLHVLKGDKEINEMCDKKMENVESDLLVIYFEHDVSQPVYGPDVVEVDSPSSNDGYETTEDEPYKPPPTGLESDSSSSDEEVNVQRKSVRKKQPSVRMKKAMDAGQKGARKKSCVRQQTPKKKKNVPPGIFGDKDMSPRTKKKKAKRYVGRKRKHVLSQQETDNEPNSGPSGDQGNGPGDVDPNDEARDKPNSDPVAEELDSDLEKPYKYESEAFNSPISDSDEEHKARYPDFNEDAEYGEVQFQVGQHFETMAMFKQALKDYFVYEGKELMYLKNEPKRIRARCAEEGCPWLVFCSHNSQSLSFQIKTFIGEHNCGRNLSSNMADRSWVTSKLVKRLVTQPLMTPKEALEHMKQDYNVHINYRMIYRALKAAREQVIGKEREQYGKLHDYLNEIHKSNPGSTGMVDVIPQPEGRPLFNRLYISLDACKKDFKAGCRPLIGLDGCFLKGYFGGHLLSAVGQDANNSFFVIAFAVVEAENTDSWKWFLSILHDDLGSVAANGWNFMSDQQKGLAKALHEVMPQAHHRNCVLHIWKNFIKHFKDKHTKGLVWKAAKSTTMREFKDSMELVKKVNTAAWEYLQKFDPGSWTKAYFSHGPKCDNITNNMCEVWNAKIVEYREKPILTMCEELRSYIMRKMAGHKHRISKCKGKLAPVQQLRLDEYIIPESNKWTAEWAGDEARVLFEVQRYQTRVAVNLQRHTCACNVWQLTGLPCKHAVSAISRLRKQGLKPEDFAHKWLTMDAVRATYGDSIKPVNSEEFWEETNRLRPEAPIIRRPPGRPTKKRAVDVVAESQMQQQGHKVRKSFQVTCSKCGQKGHYHMTCKGAPANPNW